MAETVDVRRKPPRDLVQRIAAILRGGGLAIGPTDTLYGIFTDAENQRAVQRIFALKQRPAGMLLPLIAADRKQVERWVALSGVAAKLAQQFWPGPLTLALPARPPAPRHLLAPDGTLAVRIPAHPLCRELAQSVGNPLTATSANLSGQPPARRLQEIPQILRENVEVLLDAGTLPATRPSTLVKISEKGEIQILREGMISAEQLTEIVGEDRIGS